MKMNAERLDDLLGMSTFKEFGRKKNGRLSVSSTHVFRIISFFNYLVVQRIIDERNWKLLFIVSICCFDIMV
jgi:hypothetical protein